MSGIFRGLASDRRGAEGKKLGRPERSPHAISLCDCRLPVLGTHLVGPEIKEDKNQDKTAKDGGRRKKEEERDRKLRDDGLLGCQRPFLDASKILLMERCRKFGVVSASYELNGTKPHQLNDQRILSP